MNGIHMLRSHQFMLETKFDVSILIKIYIYIYIWWLAKRPLPLLMNKCIWLITMAAESNFVFGYNKRRSLGRYSSLADSDHGVCLFVCCYNNY
jgi:hypothetical protein